MKILMFVIVQKIIALVYNHIMNNKCKFKLIKGLVLVILKFVVNKKYHNNKLEWIH